MSKIIACNDAAHGETINFLAKTEVIQPVSFSTEGQTYTANSTWAACQWLKRSGVYDRHSIVQWHL